MFLINFASSVSSFSNSSHNSRKSLSLSIVFNTFCIASFSLICFSSLNQKKIENDLKSISLTIITGSGSHSAGHKAVLYPHLMEWLKNRNKLSVKGDLSQGIIFATIF